MDVHDMVSSSLAAVIRQSLNPDFRKDCYLLLGVTHNRDAQEVIHTRLKFRYSNATGKTSNPSEKPEARDQVQNVPSHVEESIQPIEKSDDKPPASVLESCLTVLASNTFNELDELSTDQDAKAEAADPAQSDEETQLDWDVEMC